MDIKELKDLKWYVDEEIHTKPMREKLHKLIDAEIAWQSVKDSEVVAEAIDALQNPGDHLTKFDGGFSIDFKYCNALEIAIAALLAYHKPCNDCAGITYRQTNSGKIIPADQKCIGAVPLCYQPDGDGCAYQIYGDNNDDPIDRCKACPLCCADKVRHRRIENKPLTLDELREMDGEPVWCEYINLQGEHRNGKWCIFRTIYGDIQPMDGYAEGGTDTSTICYGKTWLAYRKKPESED